MQGFEMFAIQTLLNSRGANLSNRERIALRKNCSELGRFCSMRFQRIQN